MPQGIVAVHCGAGFHNKRNYLDYNKLSKRACKRSIQILNNGGCAMDAAKEAIKVLENDPMTNAGYGSNLTINGTVETDASIMDGKTLNYGGCGAVKKLKNPIELAYVICQKQSMRMPLGLIPPSLLVDTGALQYAKTVGLKTVNNKFLITPKSLKQYHKYKNLLIDHKFKEDHLLDTVGAVCMDMNGHVAAACSSGGIILKQSGRVGQAALYASGVWADSFDIAEEPSVAVCTSGCGEHLVQTQLAKEIATGLKFNSCPTVGLYNSMTNAFMNSRHLRNVDQKLSGALVLHVNDREVSILWGHSTGSMSIGCMRTDEKKPMALISELSSDVSPGKMINVGGRYYYNEEHA